VSDDQQTPSLREGLQAAAKRSGFGKVEPGQAPTGAALLAAMGGVRGLVESILPGFAFLVVYTITQQLVPSVLIPVGIAVLFLVIRLVMRSPWTPAIAGIVGIGLSAGLALLTGRAEDNFVPGFIINAVFLTGLLVSLAVRWPVIGIIASLVTGEGSGWREDRAKFRVAVIATALWCALFAVRLSIEVPLYFAGATQTLAGFKLILGVPFYAAMLWVTWLLARTVYTRVDRD
jgi:hypothetical protein